MTAIVLRGDSAHLPLPDASVDLIVTSPPYWALRSYSDNGEHYEGQIGSEETWQEYLEALWRCTAEWARVLKPEGSMFIDLGDKYDSGTTTARVNPGTVKNGTGQGWNQGTPRVSTGRPKSLLLLPERYRIGCVDRLGLIAREVIEWSKVNPLPESVRDRCARTHEDVVHLVKRERYFAAVDEIREAVQADQHTLSRRDRTDRRLAAANAGQTSAVNPLGKLPGSVWEIPSQPLVVPVHLGVEHFAAFPMDLPRRIILGWSPSGICTACGEGRRPVRGVDWSRVPHSLTEKRALTPHEVAGWCTEFADWCDAAEVSRADLDDAAGTSDMGGWWASRLPHRAAVPTPEQWAKIRTVFDPPDELDALVHLTRLVPVADIEDGSGNILTGRHNRRAKSMTFGEYGAIVGYACACPDASAPTRPALVVDPFGGTGTTSLVADALGRTGISFDRSMDYCRLARWRTSDPAERARALGVPKPPPVPEGQGSLFDHLEAS